MQNTIASFLSDGFPKLLSFASKHCSSAANGLLSTAQDCVNPICWQVAAFLVVSICASCAFAQPQATKTSQQPATIEDSVQRESAPEYPHGENADVFQDARGNADQVATSNPMKMNRSLRWASAEYLMWSIDRYGIPSLVTSSPVGTPSSNSGILNSSNTTSLLDGEFGSSLQSGFKIGMGGWFDASLNSGYEVNYMSLPKDTFRHSFDNSEFPILARPIFDATLGREAASLVAYPNVLRGNVTVEGTSELQFVEGLFRERWSQGPSAHVDFLVGCQYGELHEKLSINQFSQFLNGQGPIAGGTTKQLSDEFSTRNQFYGGVVGFDYRERIGWSRLSIRPSLAYGMNDTKVDIRGSTTTTVPGAGSASFTGGLLAQSTNIGTYSDRTMIVLPALAVQLQTPVGPYCQLTVGYNLHYWTQAVRPGSQIDRAVSQFPPETPTGDRHPTFAFEKEGVLIHGLQTGLVFSY